MNRIRVLFAGFLMVCDAFACTTFCLDTPNGPVYGANLDLLVQGDGMVFINKRGIEKSGLQKSTTEEVVKWTSKYGSVSFNLAGREFVWGGMNEAGLVAGTLELLPGRFPEPDERPALSIGTWGQHVLDTCSTIDEVIALDKTIRIADQAPPAHFFICDAEGNCVSIEFIEGVQVFRSGKELPVKVMTNSTYDESLKTFDRGGPRWWERDRGQTRKRFSRAANRNIAYSSSGETNAIKYAFETLTRDVVAGNTKWNVVYNIPEREVWFRSVRSPAVKHLSLKDFDLTGDATPLMLDIHAAVEGNVKDAFVPYDREANLIVFRNLCMRYNIEISEQDALGIMDHFETFSIAESE